MEIVVKEYDAPCGRLVLGAFANRLCLCDWVQGKHREQNEQRLKRILSADFRTGSSSLLDAAASQLGEYFARQRRGFDIPLLFAGTGFQKKVWQALLEIPYGATVSYSGLAVCIGLPCAVRAVANANGANAISIFAPCHRVIGSDNSLTGYAGGLQAKQFLLNLERNNRVQVSF